MRPSPRAVAALVIFVASTFAGLYFATQLVIAYPPPIQRPFGEALAINLTYYWLWGLSVPLVIWVAGRFRFERGMWHASLIVHAAWGVALTIVQIVIAEWFLRTFTTARSIPDAKSIERAVLDN